MIQLKLIRTFYSPDYTDGILLFNGNFFCYTLEDRTREKGEAKVQGLTAIPAGSYRVNVTMSPKFKKLMPLIMNVPGFTGIRMHGGLDATHTDGCPLLGYERPSSGRLAKPAGEDLTKKLIGKGCQIDILNTGAGCYRATV